MSTPFFLFSTPRSGSTLLMRMLADSPGICCAGEADGLLWSIKDLHGRREALRQKSSKAFLPLADQIATNHFPCHLNRSTEQSWNGMVRETLRAWVNPPEDAEFWGLKDVHAGRFGTSTGFALWQWLRDAMPDAVFLFLRREYDKRLLSMTRNQDWWIPSYGPCWGGVETRLQNQDRAFGEAAALFGPQVATLIDYRDLMDFELIAGKLAPLGLDLDRAAHARQLSIRL